MSIYVNDLFWNTGFDAVRLMKKLDDETLISSLACGVVVVVVIVLNLIILVRRATALRMVSSSVWATGPGSLGITISIATTIIAIIIILASISLFDQTRAHDMDPFLAH